jgi:hypothetical protein
LGIRSDTHDDPMDLISPIIRRPSIGKEKTSLLDRRPTTCPRDRRLGPALIAAALVLGLVGEEATASTATVSAGHGPAAGASRHGHRCKCRMHCKTVCCCVHDEPRTQTQAGSHAAPSPVPSTPTPPTVVAGPCFKAAPCDQAALPTAAAGARVSPPAAQSIEATLRPEIAGALVSIPSVAIPPSTAPSRIDEPPESRARA